MSLMVSISGIRGIVGRTLTPDVAMRYAAAFAEYCRLHHPGKKEIVIGRDGRRTGKMIVDVIAGTLAAKGVSVIDLGICATPTVQLAVERRGAAGGIAVTASHNPMEWNGMKFVAATGLFLDADENREFWSLLDRPAPYEGWETAGSVEASPLWGERHVDEVLALPLLLPDAIRKRRAKVVLDCINAAGGTIVPRLLDSLNCNVIPMNCDVSGVFARPPEPIPENLTAVAARVKREHADLGIVVDPDVDRLVLINELGNPVGEEYTITTAVDFVLRKTKEASSTVVVNLSTTRAVEDVAARYGARCLRTPVGEINVARRMRDEKAVVGGEGSGGVILPAVHLGRDAIVGIGLILQALTDFGGTMSALKATLPQYQIAKGKVTLGSTPAETIMKKLADRYAGTARVNTDDGYKFDFADYWIHLRKSNTEPIMRIIAEARTMEAARGVVDAVMKDIESM